MKKISISITNAKIESFSVNIENNEPYISATVGLYTENEKKISTFSVTNRKYYGEEITFPIEIYDWLYKMLDVIEQTVTLHAQSKICLLPDKKTGKEDDFMNVPF